jgi:hypothetical protein
MSRFDESRKSGTIFAELQWSLRSIAWGEGRHKVSWDSKIDERRRVHPAGPHRVRVMSLRSIVTCGPAWSGCGSGEMIG